MFADPFKRSMERSQFRCQAAVRRRTVELTRGREAGVVVLELHPVFEPQSWNTPELSEVIGNKPDT